MTRSSAPPVSEEAERPAGQPAAASRRFDALGLVAFALYFVVGGVLVFGFGRSLIPAVQTQNETPCRSLRPAHNQVRGTVLDKGGNPVAGASVIPVIDGREGMPLSSDKDGAFVVFMPRSTAVSHGRALRVRAEGKAPAETPVAMPARELIEVEVRLADEDKAGSEIVERSRVAHEAPDIAVKDLEGNEVKLSDFRGKFVVLNFWATWCEPCITEWPQVAQLAQRVSEQQEVVILAVSIDEDKAAIGPFLEQMSLSDTPVRVLWDPTTEIHREFGSDKIPDTFFVDEQGMVSSVFVNVREWGSPDALHCLESSLGG